ncbi:MAG: putative chemotaxis phosphatase, CheZ [Ignavibacteria bacterium]|nr:putative chemotaxis phosphatase, CheZ [Ignavibacteria bacterium]
MREKDITILLKKAEELKALFVLGQRVIPFLEEIFVFVSEIKPILDEINVSIADNLKKMPNASKQLSKVTEATELATTEIMDIVEALVDKADSISESLSEIKQNNINQSSEPLKLLEIIFKAIQKESDQKVLLPKIAKSIQQLRKSNEIRSEENTRKIENVLQSIREDSSSIMMSLQVQDITTQQIAAVNHLLETIQDKLSRILSQFQEADVDSLVDGDNLYHENINITKLHRSIAFDPEAVDAISFKESRQDLVDDLLREHNKANDITKTLNKNESDIPFNTNKNSLKQSKITEQTDDSLETFSQEDIDAMFGK